MKKTTLITCFLILLSSCQSHEQWADKECSSMGALPGSPNYYQCRQRLYENEERLAVQRESAQRIAGQNALNSAISAPNIYTTPIVAPVLPQQNNFSARCRTYKNLFTNDIITECN